MLLALKDMVTRGEGTGQKRVSVEELLLDDVFRHPVYGLHRVTTEDAVLSSLEAGRRFRWGGHWYILKRSGNALMPSRLQRKAPFSPVAEDATGMPIAHNQTVSVLVFLPVRRE